MKMDHLEQQYHKSTDKILTWVMTPNNVSESPATLMEKESMQHWRGNIMILFCCHTQYFMIYI